MTRQCAAEVACRVLFARELAKMRLRPRRSPLTPNRTVQLQRLAEIWSSKDSVITVAVAKDKITTIAPPAATGFALLEGRGLHAGV